MRLLFPSLLLLLAGCAPGTPDASETPPNIVLIMADDLGYETLGVNGGESYRTPRLDALAGAGMRFTHAYSTPLCTPTRVQIMTGKYNFRNYVGFGILDPGERTFAHLLRDAGYRTAVVGKWQLWGNARQIELAGQTGSLPDTAGFDEHFLWQVRERGFRFKNPYLTENGAPPKTYEGAYGPDLFVDFIERFLERDHDRPFFLYYPMVLTHDPFQPTPADSGYAGFDPESRLNDPAYFDDYVAYMDRLVGRIADALARTGLSENTLLLFIGDNGTDRDVVSRFEGREIRGHKGYPTEAGTHVPMIAHWPGRIAPGQLNDHLIDFTDFLPTILEAAGTGVPAGFLTDGLSFYGQLLGEADTTRAWVFNHYAPNWGSFENSRHVHDGVWKLYGDGRFYHVVDDPLETTPLDVAALPPDVQALHGRFEAVLARMQ